MLVFGSEKKFLASMSVSHPPIAQIENMNHQFQIKMLSVPNPSTTPDPVSPTEKLLKDLEACTYRLAVPSNAIGCDVLVLGDFERYDGALRGGVVST